MSINTPSVFTGTPQFPQGATFGGTVTLPAASVGNSNITGVIDASKQEHRIGTHYAQAGGTAIVAATVDCGVVYGATGSLVSLRAALTGSVTAGDYTVTIDLHRSTGGGAFATVLSSTIVLDSSSVIRVAEAAAFSSTAILTGDLLRLVVTVAGTTGSQSQGLVVQLLRDEKPS